MTQSRLKLLKNAVLMALLVAASAGWLYVIYNNHRANDPTEIVKKHFVFYPEYSHGAWSETACRQSEGENCHEVTYTVPVEGCGPVTFDWRVYPSSDDGEATWLYNGPSPKFDENKYPLYAVLNADSRLIDSPALGKPLPSACRSN